MADIDILFSIERKIIGNEMFIIVGDKRIPVSKNVHLRNLSSSGWDELNKKIAEAGKAMLRNRELQYKEGSNNLTKKDWELLMRKLEEEDKKKGSSKERNKSNKEPALKLERQSDGEMCIVCQGIKIYLKDTQYLKKLTEEDWKLVNRMIEEERKKLYSEKKKRQIHENPRDRHLNLIFKFGDKKMVSEQSQLTNKKPQRNLPSSSSDDDDDKLKRTKINHKLGHKEKESSEPSTSDEESEITNQELFQRKKESEGKRKADDKLLAGAKDERHHKLVEPVDGLNLTDSLILIREDLVDKELHNKKNVNKTEKDGKVSSSGMSASQQKDASESQSKKDMSKSQNKIDNEREISKKDINASEDQPEKQGDGSRKDDVDNLELKKSVSGRSPKAEGSKLLKPSASLHPSLQNIDHAPQGLVNQSKSETLFQRKYTDNRSQEDYSDENLPSTSTSQGKKSPKSDHRGQREDSENEAVGVESEAGTGIDSRKKSSYSWTSLSSQETITSTTGALNCITARDRKLRPPRTKIRTLQDLLTGRADFVTNSTDQFVIRWKPPEEYTPQQHEARRNDITDLEADEEVTKKRNWLGLFAWCCGRGNKDDGLGNTASENLRGENLQVEVTKRPRQDDPASATIDDETMEVLLAAERKKIIAKYVKEDLGKEGVPKQIKKIRKLSE